MSETHDATAPIVAGYAVERLSAEAEWARSSGRTTRGSSVRSPSSCSPERADDPAFRERLLRESRLAASLDHPNVVPVYDAGEVDGRCSS